MSFRKRNVGIPSSSHAAARAQVPASPPLSAPRAVTLPRGVRPSPIDGRPTTSTGTPSLDEQLAGHGGLALGTSILLEENGTTDYAGILLKFYAAEGLVQGHTVHVIGVSEPWAKELPGLVGAHESAADRRGGDAAERATDKMKIAWRYERLAQSGAEVASSRGMKSSALLCSEDVSAEGYWSMKRPLRLLRLCGHHKEHLFTSS
jgi:elongator complex protein 4